MSIPVVFDINVLVDAVVIGGGDYGPWPTSPPTSTNPAAECIGIVNDADQFGLWLSPHIGENTIRVLRELGQPDEAAMLYMEVLADVAEASGGGMVEPRQTVSDCDDWEDWEDWEDPGPGRRRRGHHARIERHRPAVHEPVARPADRHAKGLRFARGRPAARAAQQIASPSLLKTRHRRPLSATLSSAQNVRSS